MICIHNFQFQLWILEGKNIGKSYLDIQVRLVVQYYMYTGVADLDPVDSEPFMRDPYKKSRIQPIINRLGGEKCFGHFHTHKKTLSQLSHHPNTDIL